MGGKSTPEAPDYTSAAQAQAQSSRNATNSQTVANRPNQITPFGSQTWDRQESFDQSAYDRAMQDWQAQGARLGKDANNPDYLALRPQQNDFYSNEWTQNTTLNPEAQRALDSQLGLQADRSQLGASLMPRAQQEFGSAMDWGGFTPLAQGPQAQRTGPESLQRSLSTDGLPGINSSDRYYDEAGDAMFNQWSSRNEPQMQRQLEQMDTRLRNQGLKPGDQAYDQAIKDMRDQQSYARNDASMSATQLAGQEAGRMFGMDSSARGQLFGERGAQGSFANTSADMAFNQNRQSNNDLFGQGLTSANYQNQLRQQQIAEQMQRRGFSLNEINALISGQQVGMPNMPGFNSAGASQPVGYSGAAQNQYSSALDAYNAKQGAIGNLFGGVTDLAGAAFPFGF